MDSTLAAKETRIRIVTLGILLSGFTLAIAVYFANLGLSDTSSEELELSKQYIHQLETYGGKANVLATEFRQWFNRLWHGKSLAYTIAFFSILFSWLYNVIATPVPPVDVDELGRHNDEN